MNKRIKSLLLVVIVLLGVLTLSGCNNYKYPSEIPTISNPNDVYVTIGDYKVTNEQLYYRALANYGVDTLNSLIDDVLLPSFDSLTADEKADYQDYYNVLVYGTEDVSSLDEDEKEDMLKTFKQNQVLQGYYTDAEIEEAVKLEYRRYVFAANQVKKEIAEFEPVKDDDGEVIQEEYFTETEVNNATSVAYPNESTIILLTFRSELEAKALMQSAGIYVDNIDYRGWRKANTDGTAGDLMTQKEVYDAFIKMYNELYATYGDEIKADAYKQEGDKFVWSLENKVDGNNNFKYNYTELASLSSTIAKKVFDSLTTKNFQSSYTMAPNKYLTKYFLAVELDEKVYEDIEQTDENLQKQLIKNKLTAAKVEYYLYKNRVDANLVIYDRGLETPYKEDFDTIYEGLKLEERYEKTKLTSKTNVVTFDVNGKEVAITADQMLETLTNRYGVATAIGYVSQYITLGNSEFNKVYNFVTGEILDQEAYDELYEEEIDKYKEELKNNTFASVGYPKGYGWDNFLRDRFGVLNELELLAFGAIYDETLEKLGDSRYTFSNDASDAIDKLFQKFVQGEINRDEYLKQIESYVEDAENTVQYQMQKIADEFYSVEAVNVRAFVDLDHNGSADDLTDALATTAEKLVGLILVEADNTAIKGDTYAERIATLVKEYNLASINDPKYAEYKKAGIEVSVSTSTSYSSAKNSDESLGAVLKGLWNQVKDGKFADKKFTSTVKSVEFSNELISDFHKTETAVSRYVVTKATDYTYTKNTTSSQVVLPTEELINRYLIVNKPADEKNDEELKLTVSTREKAAIEAYYNVALNTFTSEDALGDLLIEIREELLDKGTIKFTNSKELERYEILMENLD